MRKEIFVSIVLILVGQSSLCLGMVKANLKSSQVGSSKVTIPSTSVPDDFVNKLVTLKLRRNLDEDFTIQSSLGDPVLEVIIKNGNSIAIASATGTQNFTTLEDRIFSVALKKDTHNTGFITLENGKVVEVQAQIGFEDYGDGMVYSSGIVMMLHGNPKLINEVNLPNSRLAQTDILQGNFKEAFALRETVPVLPRIDVEGFMRELESLKIRRALDEKFSLWVEGHVIAISIKNGNTISYCDFETSNIDKDGISRTFQEKIFSVSVKPDVARTDQIFVTLESGQVVVIDRRPNDGGQTTNQNMMRIFGDPKKFNEVANPNSRKAQAEKLQQQN